jgi:hypothetical protein
LTGAVLVTVTYCPNAGSHAAAVADTVAEPELNGTLFPDVTVAVHRVGVLEHSTWLENDPAAMAKRVPRWLTVPERKTVVGWLQWHQCRCRGRGTDRVGAAKATFHQSPFAPLIAISTPPGSLVIVRDADSGTTAPAGEARKSSARHSGQAGERDEGPVRL